MAEREGLQLVAVAETHIHADYVSGARELADRVGAKLYVSDEGPAEWKYLYLDGYEHQRLTDGDRFEIGNIVFEVMHTPGHTPESISFVLTDQGGGADRPMGIFTGDFVFVGSIGRPDLLEEAAGMAGTAEAGARDLFLSAQRFKQLPDYLQVWPAHGAGSACGKGLGAIPSSTVGYEKLFNPALQYQDEEAFVRYILADQPDAPKYFAVMKRVNKEGPRLLRDLPEPARFQPERAKAVASEQTVIDVAPSDQFGRSHVPGTWNIPLSMLAAWAGWLVDYSQPVSLIADRDQIDEAIRVLRKIGVNEIAGYFDSTSIQAAGMADESYGSAEPRELAGRIKAGELQLVDVRSQAEWNEGFIPNANHLFLGRLPENLEQVEKNRPVVTQCKSGARSAIAASIFQAAGYDVINLSGGYTAWKQAGLTTTKQKAQQEASLSR
jgi:hydroxyacylglutathione hydrolase